MRRQEAILFDKPYPNDSEEIGTQFAKALGIDLSNVRALATSLLADLDPTIFGIGWWTAYPKLGTKRRILIGDYLVGLVESIEINVTEARLHFFELLEWWERQGALMSDAVAPDLLTGGLRINHPPQTSPNVRLPGAMCTIHTAGFFRAINSALDCLGAVVAGIAALPLRIVRCDLYKARTNLLSRLGNQADPRYHLALSFQRAVTEAGPAGWLDWVTQFRHMLLHRARRIQAAELVPRAPQLYGPSNQPLLRADVVPLLPTEPAWSDIDVVRAGATGEVLHEHAMETASGVFASTVSLLEQTCSSLREFWATRKALPSLVEQPPEQWPNTDVPLSAGFAGYSSQSLNEGHLAASPSYVYRLRCAALTVEHIHLWTAFT